jgi:hypothetical protein
MKLNCRKVIDVELYSRYQSWPVNPHGSIPHNHLPLWENWGIPLTLSITATDQAEQGNHYFPVDMSGRSHIELFQTRIRLSNKCQRCM